MKGTDKEDDEYKANTVKFIVFLSNGVCTNQLHRSC